MKRKSATFKYNYYDETGRRRCKTFSAPTRAAARRLAEEWEDEHLRGGNHAPMTIVAALNAFIDGKAPVLSPTTVRSYRGIVSSRFDGTELGDLEVSRLTLSDAQKWVNSGVVKGLSPKTVKDHLALFKSATKGLVRFNWDDVAIPQQRRFVGHTPTDDEIQTLLAYTRGQSDPTLYRAILLTAFGPLRRSETCAIRPEDIHGNAVTIDKAMVKDDSGSWVIKTTKTADSTRTIVYPDFVIREIANAEGPYVINCNPDALARRFERALRFAKLPHFRFHDLRHYGASIMMYMGGISQRTIENRGGWSRNSPVLRQIYQNTLADKEAAETEKINLYFSQFEVKY